VVGVDDDSPTIAVFLTERQAIAAAHAIELIRDVLSPPARNSLGMEPGTAALELAHSRLLHAIETQQEVAA
jgi:hypothetical protein